MNIAIIGAGVAGLCCATELAARGIKVALYERGTEIGAQACSWYAGGMLAPYCEAESAEEPVVRLGMSAAAWWQRHTNSVSHNGSLVLASGRDQAELQRFARRTRQFERVDAAAIEALEPDLAGHFQNGLFFADEAHLNPRLALQDLAQGLDTQAVPIHFASEVNADDLAADLVIDCRGLAARDQLTDLRGVKGEMLLLRSNEIKLSRPIRLLHPRIPLYIVPHTETLYMVGATMIESSERTRISVRSMLELLGAAYALHPVFAEAEIIEIGVDARPAFADNIPRLRRHGRTWSINGLFRHGYLLAPALAVMTADAVLNPNYVAELIDDPGDKQ